MSIRITLAALILGAMSSPAAGPSAEEYRVKGAFLLSFARFVEWPAQTFPKPEDAIAVCIYGANPFGPSLEEAAQKAGTAGRATQVRMIKLPQQARQCHVLFVGDSERKHAQALLDSLKGGSVLTVGESEGFLASGGIINFRVEENKVHIEINAANAERAALHINAKLMSLAQSNKR